MWIATKEETAMETVVGKYNSNWMGSTEVCHTLVLTYPDLRIRGFWFLGGINELLHWCLWLAGLA